MVLAKYEIGKWDLVDSLDETSRGSGGFGSTG
jgi:dUTPase